MKDKYLVVLLGPTGVGKTDLSIFLARSLKTGIVSSDSRQIFKEMKIGTAVPDMETLNAVPHYFIQNRSIHDYYNASKFEFEVISLLDNLFEKSEVVLMVGGSTLYIDAVCLGIDDLPEIDKEIRSNLINKLEIEGLESLRFELKRLDPEYYEMVDLKNKARILRALEVCIQTGKKYSDFRSETTKERPFEIIYIGLERDREELYDRINQRVDIMIREGLAEEARKLFPLRHLTALKTVGYRELFSHFNGEITMEEAIEKIKSNTRHYARRQITWFRRNQKIKWFHPDQHKEILEYIEGLRSS